MDESSLAPRRQPLSAAQWKEIVGQWRQTGLSATAYARQSGVSVQGLWKWGRRNTEGGAAGDGRVTGAHREGPRFLSVQVGQRPRKSEDENDTGGALELHLPSGHILRLTGTVSSANVSAVLRGIAGE